jgi:ribose 5-phosphate isomerase RpiB
MPGVVVSYPTFQTRVPWVHQAGANLTVGPIGARLKAQTRNAGVYVVIDFDHAGLSLKQGLVMHLRGRGHDATDVASFDSNTVDRPDIARALTVRILSGEAVRGHRIRGTGVGAWLARNLIDACLAAQFFTDPDCRRRVVRLHEMEAS